MTVKPFALALSLAALPLLAQADPFLEPGQWTQTIQTLLPSGETLPERTLERCLSSADVADMRQALSNNQQDGCRVEQYQREGDQVNWTVHCQEPESVSRGQLTRESPRAYRLQMDISATQQGETRTTQVEGRSERIGDCPEQE